MSDGEMKRVRSKMHARTWIIAAEFREPEDYGIPHAPVNEAPDGGPFMGASGDTMKVRR
jgi:hypothetical protein